MNRKILIITIVIFTLLIICLVAFLNKSNRYNDLSITKTEWENIKESRNENNNLVLENIMFNEYNLIIDDSASTLYYSCINDSQTKYNPSVKYKASNSNANIVILLDEITDEKVKNNHKFKVMLYTDKEYHIYRLFCKDLPILNIKYSEEFKSKDKNIPIEMYLFNNLSNTTNKVTMSTGKLKNENDNYTFSLNKMSPGKNLRENKVSLLNMKPNSQYCLTKLNTDSQPIENTKSGLIGPNNQVVELFINNEYKGIYSIESIQEDI